MKKNDLCELEIYDIAEDGSGIGRYDGFIIFCRGMLPGERGSVRIMKVTKSYAVGKMLSRSISSPRRIDPPICSNFVRGCGGCTFCHLDYPAQLIYKQKRVSDCLSRIGALSNAASLVQPVLAAESVCHYRNKSIYPFAAGADGMIVCGFYAPNSHRVIPIEEMEGCGLENDMSREIRNFILKFVNTHKLSAYDELSGQGILRALMVRTNHRGTQEAMVVLVAHAESIPGIEEYVSSITSTLPFVVSIYLCSNRNNTNVVLNGNLRQIYGRPSIRDVIGNFTGAPFFEISPLSFYQVNPAQMERLYDVVYDFLPDSPRLIYDIYCGIGTIGIYLLARLRARSKISEQLPVLVGVEAVPSAVSDARKNAAANGFPDASFYCGDAAHITPEVLSQYGTPSVVILDPPRKGCDLSLIETVLSSGTDNIIYVSCNPATLARDLKLLCAAEYECRRVQPVDMFPQSGHIETVVLLSKGEIDSKKVRVEFSLEDMDMSGFQNDATYEQIKERVLQQTGLKVSSLYIAQVKQKYGIIERENYNKPKSENAKQPKCPPEKEAAITEALRDFGMIK